MSLSPAVELMTAAGPSEHRLSSSKTFLWVLDGLASAAPAAPHKDREAVTPASDRSRCAALPPPPPPALRLADTVAFYDGKPLWWFQARPDVALKRRGGGADGVALLARNRGGAASVTWEARRRHAPRFRVCVSSRCLVTPGQCAMRGALA